MKNIQRILIVAVFIITVVSSSNEVLSVTNACNALRNKSKGDSCIVNSKGNLYLYTSNYLAGAVSAIVYNGKQLIMDIGHGASMQYALSVDGLGEAYNPTEAGGKSDDYHLRQLDNIYTGDFTLKKDINWRNYADFWAQTPQSYLTSSVLSNFSNNVSSLSSKTKMAFWLTPNSIPSFWVNPQNGEKVYFPPRANSKATSDYILTKDITMDADGISDSLRINAKVTIPAIDNDIREALNNSLVYPNVTLNNKNNPSISIEAPTGYLLKEFDNYYELISSVNTPYLTNISDRHGHSDNDAPYETVNPIIYAKSDDRIAMGIYSYSNSGLSAKYHTYISDSQYSPNTSKWGVHYNTGLGSNKKDLSFTTYLVFGTKEEVKVKLLDLILRHSNGTLADRPIISAKSSTKPNGYLDGSYNGFYLYGWAVDKDDMSKPIDVHVYIDGKAGQGGKYIGKASANVYRSDLLSAGITGNHGYTFIVPKEYRDGRYHDYYLYGIDLNSNAENSLLNGSPKRIIIPLENNESEKLRISSCLPNPSNVNTGATVNWRVSAVGGRPPYTYYFSDASNVIDSNSTGRITRIYRTEGEKFMSVAVIDSENNKVDWQFCSNTVNVRESNSNSANVFKSILNIFNR